MEVTTALIAVIGTIFGGAGLKIVESLLLRRKDKDTTATDLRTELREDIRYLREELKKAETELDEQRRKHLELMQEYLDVKSKLDEALSEIKEQAAAGQAIINSI